MPSGVRSRSRLAARHSRLGARESRLATRDWVLWTRELAAFAVIAAAAIAARLPFLLRAERFFDADEAVEGLMARHVLLGEHPLFLWGQRYKGVPEIYLTSAVFRAAGSSVVAIKAVTLACFIVFLCLNFKLVERVCSRRIAWIATALSIVGPPSLVLWTLSGSAEIVMTLVCGTVLLLAVDGWRRASPPRHRLLVLAGAAIGFGLWIQQYILYYVVALAITAAWEAPEWRETLTSLVRQRSPRWVRGLLMVAAAVAACYVLLGAIAFFAGGVDVRIAGTRISATHPQKMWWIAGALCGLIIVVGAVSAFRKQLVWPAIGLLAGYAPALAGRVSNHGMGAPIGRMDFASLLAALPDIAGVMLPMLFGFRDPAGRPTVYPVLFVVVLLVIACSCRPVWRRDLTAFFHVLVVVPPVLFLISASYIDPQTYRYLMPMYAALPVVYAIGIDVVQRATRSGGAALLAFVLLIFGAQQVDWYRRLEPDRESAARIACLDRAGAKTARAVYWLSYKITFLTAERIIVAPTTGIDRYPPYSALARSAGSVEADQCR
jgi:hypothetical protein